MLKISVLNLTNYFNNFAKFGTDIVFFLFADWTVFSFKFIQGRLVPLQIYTGAFGSPSSLYRGVWFLFKFIQGRLAPLQFYTGASGSPSSLYRGVWFSFNFIQGRLVPLQVYTGASGHTGLTRVRGIRFLLFEFNII